MKTPYFKQVQIIIMKNIAGVILLAFALSGCVKEKFDAPPTGGEDPKGVSANTTIKDLKAIYTLGTGVPKKVDNDWIISGIVNADDKDGNLYKVVTIQDSTGGIQLKVDNSSLYNEFPVGRRVFVKCKDLYVGEYSGLYQVGGYVDNADGSLGYINTTVAQDKLLKGKWGISVTPVELKISDLDNTKYQSMLIKIKDLEFQCQDIYQPYADAINKGSLNRILEDCSANTITVRTSGYARFASTPTPAGKCDVTSIYTVYRSGSTWTKQLLIRNANDVNEKSNLRCDGTQVGSSADIDLATLRAYYSGATVPAPCARKIHAVVISDNSANNFDPKNLVVQDATAGITVRFSANHSFLVGDSVEINTSGGELSEFKGLLQLNNLSLSNVTKVGVTTAATTTLTFQQLNSNLKKYESMLVKVLNVTLSGNSGVYGGNVTLNDGTGSFTLYSRTGTNVATFSTTNYPSGAKTVIGVTSVYTSPQMSIRTTNDIF